MLEGFIQWVAELMIELGLHWVAASFERGHSPALAAVGYAILGALLGGVSLWLLPKHFTATHGARLTAVVIAPLAAGGLLPLGRGVRVVATRYSALIDFPTATCLRCALR